MVSTSTPGLLVPSSGGGGEERDAVFLEPDADRWGCSLSSRSECSIRRVSKSMNNCCLPRCLLLKVQRWSLTRRGGLAWRHWRAKSGVWQSRSSIYQPGALVQLCRCTLPPCRGVFCSFCLSSFTCHQVNEDTQALITRRQPEFLQQAGGVKPQSLHCNAFALHLQRQRASWHQTQSGRFPTATRMQWSANLMKRTAVSSLTLRRSSVSRGSNDRSDKKQMVWENFQAKLILTYQHELLICIVSYRNVSGETQL